MADGVIKTDFYNKVLVLKTVPKNHYEVERHSRGVFHRQAAWLSGKQAVARIRNDMLTKVVSDLTKLSYYGNIFQTASHKLCYTIKYTI